MLNRPNGLLRARLDLDAIREELEAIRKRADDRVSRDVARIESFYEGLPEHERASILTQVLRRDRDQEDRELAELTDGLDRRTRRQLFNETLDPHLQ